MAIVRNTMTVENFGTKVNHFPEGFLVSRAVSQKPKCGSSCSADDAVEDLLRQDISFLVLRAFYNLRGMLARILSEMGLDQWVRPGVGPVLYALYERDDCTISDISERTLLSASTLTGTLKAMQRSGLVRLTKDEGDRRAVRVRLTALGRKLEPQMNEMRRQVREVLGDDPQDEQSHNTKPRLAEMILAMDLHEWESNDPRKRKRRN